ncbi:flippase [Paraburkholderia hospita]|nr:flippase [Paraburkholderia hospita]EUC19396.1 polysaccharide biosynthesis protein [Burkholderia sp. BT03]SKC91911.1 polysaccharide transporter, PST family [Burkholderia sp. CF099]SOE86664.1 polysaccharide transporter, PST family [Burkholderia sp. YR290]OUL80753.1 O-antigen transporter [Paraburkholderia hospita]OUL88266.1 O-antigen transporter [Paraburkholderia hospita]
MTRLRRNFAAMVIWQIGNYLVPLATFPYLTRVLGPTGFGTVSYVTALTMYGIAVTEWGFNLSGPRAVAQSRHDHSRLNDLIWSVIGAKTCLCVLSMAILVGATCMIQRLGELKAALWIGWVGVVANVFTMHWLMQGLERFSLLSCIALVSRFSSIPLTFLLVKYPHDVNVAIGVQSAASMFGAVGSFFFAYHQGLLRNPRFSWGAVRRQIFDNAEMFLSTASVSLFSATNTVILGSLSGPYQAGVYASADKLKTVGNMIPMQINTVLYPRISALLSQGCSGDKRAAARLTTIGLVGTIATTSVGMLICVVSSRALIRLVLGSEFVAAAGVLNWLCLSTVFGNLAYFLGLQVLVPFDGASRRARAMLGAGLFNIMLACILVPHMGAGGAAIAYLVAEVALLGIYLRWVIRSPTMRAHFAQLARG